MAIDPKTAQWIAQRTVLAIDHDGREFTLTFGVGVPYEPGTGEWACPARLDGLDGLPFVLYGVDSWQALQLATQFVGHRLQSFTDRGGQLFWPEEREPMSVAELIPHLG